VVVHWVRLSGVPLTVTLALRCKLVFLSVTTIIITTCWLHLAFGEPACQK
jgi:hypothetical protein